MSIYRYLPILSAAVITIAALTLPGCAPETVDESEPVVESRAEATSAPPPLVVDTSEPLLLDEPAEEERAIEKAIGANAPCFVCHANYMDESLAVTHVKQGFACTKCHGDSFAHRNDENNTTPPEKMFARDVIAAYCRKCHSSHEASAEKMAARLKKSSPDVAGVEKAVCTDCHGNHRMKVRTVEWDKKTGKLLRTNEG